MKKLPLLLLLLLVSQTFIYAQYENSFSPEIKRVAVFKNGYAFTYREGETKIKDGWAYSNKTPIGVLGTVWGYSTTPNVKVTQLLTTKVEKFETERVTNISEVLIANEGARIRFMDYYNDKKVIEGKYEILSNHRKFKNIIANRQTKLTIVIKNENSDTFYPVESIRNLEILGKINYSKPKITKENRLKIKVDGSKEGKTTNLGIAALERGVRWIPAYRVEVKGNPVKEAKLELEAMLINELADLKDSEVFFVVGVPHFLFQNTISPLSINTAFAGVSSYFNAGAGRGRRDSFSNAIMSQVSTTYDSLSTDGGGNGSPTVTDEEQTNSFSAEQLYLYQTNQINLKKNERASLRLFSLTVPASEVFEWSLDDLPNTQKRYLDYGRNSNSVPLVQDLKSKIWYALRLKNKTGMPWTTAPALSFRDWKPLGQDMLTFTPIGGENVLRVTPATEVIGTHSLEEKAREQKTLRYGGRDYTFDLVTVEGTIGVRNIKKESVEVVLNRKLVGEMISASDDGEFSREGLNLQAVNPNSRIKWNLTIPTGKKEIKYTYKIYVRR